MIIIFTGPPFSGKDTQAKLLREKLGLPIFSMGAIIREAYDKKDARAVEGFENYSMKGLHVPIELKFDLLKDSLNKLNNFILDNFPATEEDLESFLKYLSERNLKVDHVFYLTLSKKEMEKRLIHRGREDDDPRVVEKRREIQDKDRESVLGYFKTQGLLREIEGNQSIENVHKDIMRHIDG